MEDVRIREFLSVDCGYGDDYDYGFGDGSGDGYASCDGYGFGDGYGDGYGDDRGCGRGSGYDYGSGRGYRFGFGSGSASGCGTESGFGGGAGVGGGLKSINNSTVYYIDGVPTVISRITLGAAKGYIVNGNLTLDPCWVVKQGGTFAHGKTLRDARNALIDKLFRCMPEEERIAEFVKVHKDGEIYSDKDFFEWHHKLTGSCEMGRMAFAKSKGLDKLDGSRTVQEFIALCENDYGGSTIKKLKEFYK